MSRDISMRVEVDASMDASCVSGSLCSSPACTTFGHLVDVTPMIVFAWNVMQAVALAAAQDVGYRAAHRDIRAASTEREIDCDAHGECLE